NNNSDEHTPLLKASPSGHHVVVVDTNKVEEILDAEEKDAIEEDAKLPAWTIISEESATLAKLSVPMILSTLLEFIPGTVLTMMVGHVSLTESTQILAAFQLANLVQSMLVIGLLEGLSFAVDTLCSQAYGGKRMVELWLFCQAGLLMFAICMPFMVGALLCGSWILKATGQDPAISDIAGQFLFVSALAIPLSIVFAVMKSALQAQSIVFPPLSWIVKILTLVPVILQNEVFQNSWPGWRPIEAMALVPKISKLGVSSVLMVTCQMLSSSFISLFAGLLPNADVNITANTLFTFIIAISFIPLLGVGVGGAIRLGNALGAGKARRANLIGCIMIVGSACISSIGMVTTLFVAKPFALAFTPDSQAIQVAVDLTYKLLPTLLLAGVAYGIQSILRACGRQLLAAKLNFGCIFVVGAPLGFLIAMPLNGGLAGLWLGHLVGLLVFIIVGMLWLSRVSWEQLAHEAKHNTHL
ncbi:Multidrug/oligosaccharidyl-lipid/polysaccharide, partial [Globisporangium polare]